MVRILEEIKPIRKQPLSLKQTKPKITADQVRDIKDFRQMLRDIKKDAKNQKR